MGASLLDWTGIAGAGLLAVTGLCVLPFHKARLRTNFRERVEEVREELGAVVGSHLEGELEAAMGRIQADVDPFNRFVRVQVEQLERIDNELKAVVTEMDAIALDLSTVEEGKKEEGER